jgi:hypothetical protein
MNRSTIALGIAAGLIIATPAAPATAAAEKYPLIGPFANIFCDTLVPVDGAEDIAPGFVVFNANKNKVSATVSVKDAPANVDMPIRLIQGGPGGGADCFEVDGVLRTNGQGKGTLHVQEPVTGTRAQVIIDTTALFGTPTYRGTEIFIHGE